MKIAFLVQQIRTSVLKKQWYIICMKTAKTLDTSKIFFVFATKYTSFILW